MEYQNLLILQQIYTEDVWAISPLCESAVGLKDLDKFQFGKFSNTGKRNKSREIGQVFPFKLYEVTLSCDRPAVMRTHTCTRTHTHPFGYKWTVFLRLYHNSAPCWWGPTRPKQRSKVRVLLEDWSLLTHTHIHTHTHTHTCSGNPQAPA